MTRTTAIDLDLKYAQQTNLFGYENKNRVLSDNNSWNATFIANAILRGEKDTIDEYEVGLVFLSSKLFWRSIFS